MSLIVQPTMTHHEALVVSFGWSFHAQLNSCLVLLKASVHPLQVALLLWSPEYNAVQCTFSPALVMVKFGEVAQSPTTVTAGDV